MKFLGIDPSLNNTGWGLIEQNGNDVLYINSGVISCDSRLSLCQKLSKIYRFFESFLELTDLNVVAMEKTFVNLNAFTSLKLAYVRGAIMSLIGNNKQLLFVEYAPNYVKKTIAGNGHAHKVQIAKILQFLLKNFPNDYANVALDQTDALAVAYTATNRLKKL